MSPTIRLLTEIPGPRSRALMARREAAVARGVGHSTPVAVESASGARVTDVDGNVLLDFAGGIGTLNVGHCHPDVVAAARAQLGRLTHACFSVALYEPYVALAEALCRLAPGGFPKKAFFANSGVEAVENAVKIARHATGRGGVLVFEHGFHGRTLLGMSLTGKVDPYKLGFGPFAPEVYRFPYPYEYRRTAPSTEEAYTAELRDFLATHAAAGEIACAVLELVTGEGGFIVAPLPFVRALVRVCREHRIVLVIDEIQTGFGRTGTLFACEHYGLEPDLLILAKSLAGGLPLSAVVGRAELMDHPQVGGLGGTFGGNPVACAAALAVLEVFERDRLAERGAVLGRRVEERLARLMDRFPFLGDSRGLGAMRALELVKDREGRQPDKARTSAVLRTACERGLLLLGAGTHGNVLRLLMPLVITDGELDEGLDVLEAALEAVAGPDPSRR
ncbi:MAG TPA: 4-aminobutyrate--2-oxoglutarate transaminase [Acidobacteria bacterium]|nr:4-aminobutyrate--2-oxoglutarate transaminase [Acidobacteriota bacterium]